MEGYALEPDAKKDKLSVDIEEKENPNLAPNTGNESGKKRRRLFDIRRPQGPLEPPVQSQSNNNDKEREDSGYDSANIPEQEDEDDGYFGVPMESDQSQSSYARSSDEYERMQEKAMRERMAPEQTDLNSPVNQANTAPDPSKPLNEKPEVAGGPARTPQKTPDDKKDEVKEKAAGAINAAKGELGSKGGVAKVVGMAKDAIAASRGNVLAAGRLLLKNKKLLIIVCGIALILTVLAILIPLSILGGVGKNVSSLGKTMPQQVNAVTDKDLVLNSLKLLGNPEITKEQNDTLIDQNAKEIMKAREASLAKDPTGKDPVAVRGQVALDSGNALKASRTQANAKAYIKNLGLFLSAYQNAIPKFTGSTQKPTKSTGLTFNDDLHGGSAQHKAHVDNNGVYSAYDKGTCDAVDISTGVDEAVFPIFAGKVASVTSDGKDGQIVRIQSGDYTAVYAHIAKISKTKGQDVSLDTQLGTAAGNNIQIEIIYKNKCLVTTSADVMDHSLKDRKHEAWGGYLWDHILDVFNLSQ